jgi:hypothetical protein
MNFKNNMNYNGILEHVTIDEGYKYLQLIRNNTTITESQIQEYCKMNDSIGTPKQHDYGIITCSPTCLRYIWLSHKILTHFKSLNKENYSIVEIGGGYGGLCLSLDFFSKHYSVKITNYFMIDLTWPKTLQKLYLSNFNISFPISFHEAMNYGEDIITNDSMLISTYSFSEIEDYHQKKYISLLFPKINHGFFAWNGIPTYNFGFNFFEEEETPKTGKFNKFVLF